MATYADPDAWVRDSPELRIEAGDGKQYRLMQFLQSIDRRVVALTNDMATVKAAVGDVSRRLKSGQPDSDRLTDLWRRLGEIQAALAEVGAAVAKPAEK